MMIDFAKKLAKLFALDTSDEGFAHLYTEINELNEAYCNEIRNSRPPRETGKELETFLIVLGSGIELNQNVLRNCI